MSEANANARSDQEEFLILAKALADRRSSDPLAAFKPHEKQKIFIRSVLHGDRNENWFLASNRAGKSDAGAVCGATFARFGVTRTKVQPGSVQVRDRATSGWVSCLDFPTSRDSIQPKYFDNGYVPSGQAHPPFIPKHEIADWRPDEQILRLKNGSLIGFKCQRADQEILLSDGSYVRIDQVEGAVNVISHWGRAGTEARTSRILLKACTGLKRCLEIVFSGGRSMVCTPEHRIFNGLEWIEAGSLRKGQEIRYFGAPEPTKPIELECDPFILGYVIGNGTFMGTGSVRVRCKDHGRGLGNGAALRGRIGLAHDGGTIYGWRTIIMGLGLWGLRSRERYVPVEVFRSSNVTVRQFLRGLFAADGTITVEGKVSLSTSSKRLAVDVQRLLDRFQLRATMHYIRSTDSWRVVVSRGGMFIDSIGWDKGGLDRIKPIAWRPTHLHVKEVIDAGDAETWDICCPETHCFMHASGIVTHNSAESGRKKFQSAEKDWVHMDEEHPFEIYEETVIRVGTQPLNFFCTATLLPPEGKQTQPSWVFAKIIEPYRSGKLTRAHVFGASIYDNPGIARDEIARLESVYPLNSVSRRIRLDGEWLPGMGGARAYMAFDKNLHVRPQPPMSPYRPLCWTWDFNVEPMVSLAGQMDGEIFRIHREFVMDEGSIPEMCDLFSEAYRDHAGEVWLYGDATSNRRTGQTGKSDYYIILQEMRAHRVTIRMKVPSENPRVPDRINAVNRVCKDEAGRLRLQMDPSCTELIMDMEGVLRDNRGGLLKSKTRKDPYFRRTHTSDSLGYWISYEEPVSLPSDHIRRAVNLGTPGYSFGAQKTPPPE